MKTTLLTTWPRKCRDWAYFLTRAFLVGILVAGAQAARGQQGRRPPDIGLIQFSRWPGDRSLQEETPLLIETSAPVANLLTRAEEGIERRDWKLAIDSLQRVIDDPAGTLVPREDGATDRGLLYESARRRALRRLASLPSEALLSYRILYDGKAKGLFERARLARDGASLQRLADCFLLTRYGDDAADLAASLAIDEGRYGWAVARLEDVLALSPDHDVPLVRVYAKLAAAYALMGRLDRAQTIIDEHLRTDGENTLATALEASLTEEWVHRTQQLLDESASSLGRSLLGAGPHLAPSILEPAPWRATLTGTAADLWRRISDFEPGDSAPIPRMNLVMSDQAFFVRATGGCAALDLEDLTLIWETDPKAPATPVAVALDARLNTIQGRTTRATGVYVDHPGNAVSAGHGLVFTIESQGTGEYLNRDEVGLDRFLFVRPSPRLVLGGTRLVAYDQRSGDIKWQRGRTDNADDVLGNVRFVATPLPVNDELWVTYLLGSDMYVAALRPGDGAVLKNLLLGSVRQPNPTREPRNEPAPYAPASYFDGVYYAPTGLGTVFAVDAPTMTLRWAAMYDAHSAGRRPADVRTYWVASPPLVTAGVAIVTASDFAPALGLNADTGELLWSAPVDGCSYVIAVQGGRVWFGGRRLACANVSDGSELWGTDLPDVPTGRAALCGDQIHVPLSTGLLTLAAETGAVISRQELSTSESPLGNLVCAQTALYSIEPSSLRKFPDVARMRTAALREIEEFPTRLAGAVRLAWAELLSGDPRRALHVVQQVPGTLAESDPRARQSLARVKLESLLALSRQSESAKEALELLEAADEAALSPDMRLRCRVAIADQQVRLGRQAEAYRGLMTLALSADAGQLVDLEEGIRAAARLGLRQRLGELRKSLSQGAARQVQQEYERRIAELEQSPRTKSEADLLELSALAEISPDPVLAQRALLALADQQIHRLEYEAAEQSLRQCLRLAVDPILVTRAWLRLIAVYEAQDFPPALFLDALVSLKEHLSSHPQAAELPAYEEVAGGNLDEYQSKMRSRISDPRLQLGLATFYPGAPAARTGMKLSGHVGWTYQPPSEGEPVRIAFFEEGLPAAMADRIVMMGRDGFLECVNAERNEILWRTRLQLPGTFDEFFDANARTPTVFRFGVMDGQTALFNGPAGIFAVGMLTGRLLWARSYDRLQLDLGGLATKDWTMAAKDGLVAALPRDGYLSMLRLADGSTVWERDLRGEQPARVWLHGNRVVISDADGKRVHVLDRDNGHLIRRILLRQPDAEHDRVPLMLTGGMLFGPDAASTAADAVSGFDLETGEQVWRRDVDKPIISLFLPSPGYLGAGLLGGDVKIYHSESGELALERSDPSVRAVTGGIMWNGTLVLRSNTLRGPRQAVELAAFDIATGSEVWRRKDLAYLPPGDQSLEVRGGVIPAVIEAQRVENTGRGGSITRSTAMATLIDARTGLDAGTVVDVAGPAQGVGLSGDIALWPGILAVGTMKGVQAMRVDIESLPERGF